MIRAIIWPLKLPFKISLILLKNKQVSMLCGKLSNISKYQKGPLYDKQPSSINYKQ